MRRHPVLLGFLVVIVLIVGFIILVLVLSRIGGKKPAFVLGEKIGIVEIKGMIVSSERTINQLIGYREDKGVKAIVLRIDSPGGAAVASEEIYQEVIKAREKKKVVASLGGIAASGGYYVASGADLIVANPGTITGSIGVIIQVSNVEGLMKLIGLKTYTFKSGEHKDLLSPFREPTAREREIVMGIVERAHVQFVEAVAAGRNMDVDTVRELADGRIFSGQQAMELGLVDQMGTLQDAIDVAAQMSGIRGRPNVIYPKKKWSIFDLLVEKVVMRLFESMRTLNYRLYYHVGVSTSF